MYSQPATHPDRLPRPAVITLLAVLQYIGAGFLALGAVAMLVGTFNVPDQGTRIVLSVVASLMAAFAFLQFVCGYGLWTLRPYGRTIQLVFAWIGLLGFPIGTIISILILVYLFKPGIKTLFSGRPAEDLTPQEWQAIGQVAQGSAAVAIIIAVVLLVGGVAVVGIVAAIAVPGLLRARMSANEAAAIGTMRSLISAEASYSAFNGGLFDKPECLAAPRSCNPAAGDQPFIDPSFSSAFERTGYRFVFEGQSSGTGPTGPSASSVTDFVFYATPVTPGSTGVRSFCTNATGTICSVNEPLQLERGQCPSSCQPLF